MVGHYENLVRHANMDRALMNIDETFRQLDIALNNWNPIEPPNGSESVTIVQSVMQDWVKMTCPDFSISFSYCNITRRVHKKVMHDDMLVFEEIMPIWVKKFR